MQRRLDNFQGTQAEYIIYLENQLLESRRSLFLSTYPIALPRSPSPSPDSAERESHTSKNLRFVQYDPPTGSPPSKRPRNKKPQWQEEMDSFLADIPAAKEWQERRESLGLGSTEQNRLAMSILLNDSSTASAHVAFFADAETSSSPGMDSTGQNEDVLLQCARAYAHLTKGLQSQAKFAVQLNLFQQLVFVSFCDLMIRNGYSISSVNSVMQICISNSKPKNLDRLRRGSRWVGRNISRLSEGWKNRSAEIFVICGRPVHFYGRFSDAGRESSSYFTKHLSQAKYAGPLPEPPGWIPFCIPCIIKCLVGDTLPLSKICSDLEYDEDSVLRTYEKSFKGYTCGITSNSTPLRVLVAGNQQASSSGIAYTAQPMISAANQRSMRTSLDESSINEEEFIDFQHRSDTPQTHPTSNTPPGDVFFQDVPRLFSDIPSPF